CHAPVLHLGRTRSLVEGHQTSDPANLLEDPCTRSTQTIETEEFPLFRQACPNQPPGLIARRFRRIQEPSFPSVIGNGSINHLSPPACAMWRAVEGEPRPEVLEKLQSPTGPDSSLRNRIAQIIPRK